MRGAYTCATADSQLAHRERDMDPVLSGACTACANCLALSLTAATGSAHPGRLGYVGYELGPEQGVSGVFLKTERHAN